MSKKALAVGIVLLFSISTVTPLVIGYDVEIANSEFVDDLAFDCYDRYNSSRVSYYREYFLRSLSDDLDSDRVDFLEESDVRKVTEIVEIEPNVKSVDGPMDSPWPMKCHDTHHTGRSPYNTADNSGAELWKFKSKWIEGGPVVDSDGTIYFGDTWGNFFALYPDGSVKWKFDDFDYGGSISSVPALASDGTIYVGSWDHYLYAL